MSNVRPWLVLAVLAGVVCPAAAQAIDRPPRATGGLFAQRRPSNPNQPAQELVALIDVYGGYDDNLFEALPEPNQPASARTSFVSRAETELQFRKSVPGRSLDAVGRAYVNRTTLGKTQFVGGDFSVLGFTQLGRRNGANASVSVGSEPAFLFGAFDQLASQTEDLQVVDATPAQGVTNQRWLLWRASLGAYRNLTSRQRLDAQWIRTDRRPQNGFGLEGRSQATIVRHEWRFTPSYSLLVSYNYDDNRQSDQVGESRPLVSQRADAGLNYHRQLSQRRRVTVAAGGGASHVRAFTTDSDERRTFLVPTVYGLGRFDVGRTGGVQVDVRRDVTVLQGVSPEPFASQSYSVRVDGLPVERIQIGASGAYSRGGAVVSDTGTFEAAGATVQVQFILARYASLFTAYRFYRFRLIDLSSLPEGFPSRFDRNSAQVGVTFWLPLAGRF